MARYDKWDIRGTMAEYETGQPYTLRTHESYYVLII